MLSEEVRGQLTKEIDRLTLDVQRAQQDAQAEVDELRNQLQREFQRKLSPVIQQLATEKGLQFIFNPEILYWADEALDLTAEVVKRFDTAVTAGTIK